MFTFFSINNISRYIVFAFLILFLFFVLRFSLSDKEAKEYEEIDTSGEMILARLNRAMAELAALKAQNDELHALIQNFVPFEARHDMDSFLKQSKIPSPKETAALNSNDKLNADDFLDEQFESSRRKLKSDVNELWYYLRENLNESKLEFAEDLKNSLQYDISKFFALENINLI